MIRVVDVTQHYGIKPVLKNISLEIPPGTRTAVIGPNGMGKTTLLSVMAGVLSPQHGYVEFDGLRRRASIDQEIEIRRRAIYLPDRCYLPKSKTGREFLLAVGSLYQTDKGRLIGHAQRLLNLFHLNEIADSPIRSYSAGQQKKLALSSALITEASYLLLDEPFSGGLDPAGILALRYVLERLAKKYQRTIVLTSPVPEIVAEVADRLVVIREGTIALDGTMDDLQRQSGYVGRPEDMLLHVVFPDAERNVDKYFEEEST